MKKSIKVHPKKRRGRPATGKDPLISARLPQSLIDNVEAWATANKASRSEAIRRLVEIGLERNGLSTRKSATTASARAEELATGAIDSRLAADATAEERQTRKERLLKGPSAFRDVRKDRGRGKI
jgi:Arc/MetJ-type ribon-helix-helix transcriptional regulator